MKLIIKMIDIWYDSISITDTHPDDTMMVFFPFASFSHNDLQLYLDSLQSMFDLGIEMIDAIFGEYKYMVIPHFVLNVDLSHLVDDSNKRKYNLCLISAILIKLSMCVISLLIICSDDSKQPNHLKYYVIIVNIGNNLLVGMGLRSSSMAQAKFRDELMAKFEEQATVNEQHTAKFEEQATVNEQHTAKFEEQATVNEQHTAKFEQMYLSILSAPIADEMAEQERRARLMRLQDGDY